MRIEGRKLSNGVLLGSFECGDCVRLVECGDPQAIGGLYIVVCSPNANMYAANLRTGMCRGTGGAWRCDRYVRESAAEVVIR